MWETVHTSPYEHVLCNVASPRLSTFVFNKCSEKKYSRLYLWSYLLAQRRRRWPSITCALGQSIVSICCFWRRDVNVTSIMQSSENTGSTLKQHWLNATCLHKVYNRPGDRLVLDQRRGRLLGIEPAMGCNAGQTLY